MTARAKRRRRWPLADRLGVAALGLVAGLALLLLVAPSLIVIAVSFEPRAYISFPPSGFTLRWYGEVFANRQLMDSIVVSLRVAFWVTAMVCDGLMRSRRAARNRLSSSSTLAKSRADPTSPAWRSGSMAAFQSHDAGSRTP